MLRYIYYWCGDARNNSETDSRAVSDDSLVPCQLVGGTHFQYSGTEHFTICGLRNAWAPMDAYRMTMTLFSGSDRIQRASIYLP